MRSKGIGNGVSRRGFLAGGMTFCVAATQVVPAFAASYGTGSAMSPEEALQRLEEGNRRYAGGVSVNRDYSTERAERATGQRPFAAIVSCADSRVAPEIIFDQGLGDLFVIRVAGNFVNEDGLASLEYGVAVLSIPLVMVLGHSACGAVDATIDVVKNGTTLPGHLPRLVEGIRPAVEEAIKDDPHDLLTEATVENVKDNLAYLKGAKPIVSEAVNSGKVGLVGGLYDVATGIVSIV